MQHIGWCLTCCEDKSRLPTATGLGFLPLVVGTWALKWRCRLRCAAPVFYAAFHACSQGMESIVLYLPSGDYTLKGWRALYTICMHTFQVVTTHSRNVEHCNTICTHTFQVAACVVAESMVDADDCLDGLALWSVPQHGKSLTSAGTSRV